MLERVRAVLLTYSDRLGFQVFTVIIIPLSVFVFPLFLGQSFLLSYIVLASIVVVAYSTLLGHQLKCQFASQRSSLIPNYRLAHLYSALGLSLILIVLVLGPLALSRAIGFEGPDAWRQASYTGILACLWLLGLVAFGVGYFFSPLVLFPLISLQFVFHSTKASSFFLMVLAGKNPALSLVLLLNCGVCMVLVWRMIHMHEEMFEYRWKDDGRNVGARQQKGMWSSLFSPSDAPLDRIESPLRRDFHAQLRHFQLSNGSAQGSTPQSIAILIGIIWTINFIAGINAHLVWINLLTFLPALEVIRPFPKNSLQWIFLLPFRRTEILVRLGGALFVSVLRSWSVFALATYFVEWMPLPGTVQGLPPLMPFAASLAAQFPLFGVVTLALLWGNASASALAFGGVVMVYVFFTSLASTVGQAALLIIGLVLSGVGLSWASYRRWCEAEV